MATHSEIPELEELIKKLDSTILYDIAYAASHLGMSGDTRAVEPLLNKAMNSKDWLIREFAIRGLKCLEIKLPEAGTALEKIAKNEPPPPGLIVSIKPTDMTIHVTFDFEMGTLNIGGRARCSDFDYRLIYKTIKYLLDQFNEAYPEKPLVITLRFDILDSGNVKSLLFLLKSTIQNPNIIIYWYCEEEDPEMLDLVEQYNELGRLRIIPVIINYDTEFHKLLFLR
jgi:hypothetical protein